jgi:hypothetical protein
MLYRRPDGKVTAVVPGTINQILTLVDDGGGNLIPDWRDSTLADRVTDWFAPEDAIYDQVTVNGVGPIDLPKPDTAGTRPALGFRTGSVEADNEGIAWQYAMHEDYDGGDFTVEVYWAQEGVATDNVGWQVAIERVSPAGLDLSTDSFAAPTTTVTTAAPGVTDQLVITTVALPNSDMDGLLAGEPFRFFLQRDNTVATNLGDTAKVVRVVMIEDAVSP